MRRSRIRWLRRILLKIAMWRDPEALLPKNTDEAQRIFDDAVHGSLESELVLERSYYAYCYLRGSKPLGAA